MGTVNPVGLPPPKRTMYECGATTASVGNLKWSFNGLLSPSFHPAKEMGSEPALYSSMNSSPYVSRTCRRRLASPSRSLRRVGEDFANEEGIVRFGDDVGAAGRKQGLDRRSGFVRNPCRSLSSGCRTRDCFLGQEAMRDDGDLMFRFCPLGEFSRPFRSVRCRFFRRRYRQGQ